MKKNKREIYLELCNLDNPLVWSGLCLFCKYAQWTGSACYDDANLDCKHSLEIVVERCWDVWQGCDCWGFRPGHPLSDVADFMGLVIQGIYPKWGSEPKRVNNQKAV